MILRALLICVLFALPNFAQIVSITGKFLNPDGTNVNGRVSVMLTQSTVRNTCGSTAQVITFRPVGATITNGVLGSLTLYSTPCLSPKQLYNVVVTDSSGSILYRGQWTVPANVASVDVSLLDAR
jgi:hypothetical protein